MKLPFGIKTFGCMAILGTLLAAGCFKKDDVSSDTDSVVNSSVDDAEADVLYNDVYNDVSGVDSTISITQTDVGAPDLGASPPGTTFCYTKTISPAGFSFPKTVTLDFGSGCLGRDGKFRKGKIITVFSDWLRKPGATAVTTFSGYSVNAVTVEGKQTITNTSTATTRAYTRVVENGKLSKVNGNYIIWSANYTHTQTAGVATPFYYWDDEFTITGSASGQSSRNGNLIAWTRTITSPLHRKATCRWRDAGTIAITHNSHAATLDFGAGNCDNKATITYNGITKEITL